jgi:hypothetical protein
MSSVIAVFVVPNDLTIYYAMIRTRSSPSVAIGRGIAVSRTQHDLIGGTKTRRALFYNLQIKSSLLRKKIHTQAANKKLLPRSSTETETKKEASSLCTSRPCPPPKLMNNIR